MNSNQPGDNPSYDYPGAIPAGSGVPDQNVDYTYNPATSMAANDPTLNPAVGQTGAGGPWVGSGAANADGSRSYQGHTGAEASAAAGDAPPETAQIRAEIEDTRSQMSSTIDAIQEKLNPGNLVDQAKESVREATIGRVQNMASDARETVKDAGNSFWATVKENPLPAALAAVGLGWLFMKSREKGSKQTRTVVYDTYAPRPAPTYDRYGYRYAPDYRGYDYRAQRQGGGPGEAVGRVANRAGDVAGNVADKAGDVAGNVRDTVGEAAGNVAGAVGSAAGNVADAVGNVAGSVRENAGDFAGNVQQGIGNVGSGIQSTAQQAGNQFQRWLYESPLAVGAAAVVLGAAVGLAIPETEPEHKLMGEARDTLVERAQSAASGAVDKVTQVAQQAGQAAQQAAKQEAQNQGLTPQ